MLPRRIALACVLLAPGIAPAADVSPEARRLLDDVAKAYKALAGYSDAGEVRLSVVAKPGGPATTQAVPAKVALARPNRIAIDAGFVRVASDGKTLRTTVPPLKTYRDQPAPALLSLADLNDGPLGAVQQSGPQGRPLAVLLSFLLADDPVRSLVDDARSIRVEPGAKRDGVPRDKVTYEPQVGPTLTLWIDPATKLLDRIDVGLAPDPSAGGPIPGLSLAIESLAWVAGSVETKTPPDAAFAPTKPDGFAEIAALAKDVARAKAEHEMVGQPAPDFSLNVLDGPGKTRRIVAADLAGKVVLLDFWATWCGPCLRELPDIQTLVGDYAKAKKGVVVAAVSIDKTEDGDLDDVRALVEKTLKEKGIDVQVPPVGLVALDPTGTIARAFKAQAIPQLVIIDAKGVVRHVHIGVTGKEALVEEIDALLAEAIKP